ncbi:MAG: protein kinase [Ignavibacteriaceae bacterium]
MIGQNISHYKIIDKLGEGGMGEVYKAEDIKLKRIVALKFLPVSFASDEEAKKRFIHEAQSASALDHNNICTVYEIGETENNQLFIAMAYYEGETLDAKIEKGLFESGEAIKIIHQICNGLYKAHKNQIVHRDIKPANIFITNEGIVKILDFGLAKGKGQSRLTQIGTTVGTIAYMSPEQARGEKVDQRSDIWSLGVVIYEMLTGTVPFNADYDQATIYSILNDQPDFNKLPAEFVPILEKLLSKSPDNRYESVKELISDLESLGNESGNEKEYSFASMRSAGINSKTKVITASISILVLILAALFYSNIINSNKSPDNPALPERKMIVVLPFENLGPPEDAYFAQGMREEISNKLASLGSIGVISRNSAEKFANSNKSTKEIGKELGVDYILEGTVQWAKNSNKSNRIRIIPQLVRVSDDINIWSDSYDRIIDDVFEIQNEIAQSVVDKLGIKILPGQTVTGPPPTKNINAYDYYLKALPFHYGPTTGDNLKTCIKLYEKAIELDTNFAAAYAQISIAYMGLFKWYWDRDSLNLKKSSIYLKKAKEIDPDIAEVHLSQFFYYAWFTNDREKVFQELKKVLEIQPNNAEALWQISGFYYREGKIDLSKECDQKSMQLDPLNARYPWGIGLDYQIRRDYESAEKYLKRAIELSPNSSFQYVDLARNYLDWKGNTELARKTINRIKDNDYLDYYANIFIYLDILDRNFKNAIDQLKSSKKEYENSMERYIPNSQMIGFIYKYMGENVLSKKYLDSSIIIIQKIIRTKSDDPRLHLALGKSYAGLGKLKEALGEINKAIELSTSLTGAWRKYTHSRYLAVIYTLTGEQENALKQIDFLLSNPTGFSVNILKLDPLYDPLRNLPEYKRIIEKYSSEIPLKK